MQLSKNQNLLSIPRLFARKFQSSQNLNIAFVVLLFPALSVGVVGLTGLEPVTLRLSSACSNQLSYRPIGEKLFFGLPVSLFPN